MGLLAGHRPTRTALVIHRPCATTSSAKPSWTRKTPGPRLNGQRARSCARLARLVHDSYPNAEPGQPQREYQPGRASACNQYLRLVRVHCGFHVRILEPQFPVVVYSFDLVFRSPLPLYIYALRQSWFTKMRLAAAIGPPRVFESSRGMKDVSPGWSAQSRAAGRVPRIPLRRGYRTWLKSTGR